jgi:5-methylcytosine-specific restriction endonuclease McrA
MPWHDHPAWSGSTRKNRLPTDWRMLRARVLERDGHRCVICGALANQVDHIAPGDDHSMHNLRALCPEHHHAKSAREGSVAANAKRWARDSTRRPPEPHPGLR